MSNPLDRPPVPRRLRRVGVVIACVALAVVAYGLVSRTVQNARVREATAAQALPAVAVVEPKRIESAVDLVLPGRLQAFIRAPIYARVPGYLKSWRYDIGARVRAGAVLAEIDTPDLDQQLAQARADLAVAEANAQLAEVSAKRWQALAGTDAVSKQDVDQRTYTWNASLAQVRSARANVDRLVAQAGFKRLLAPFDGMVTARTTDIGALIDVGAGGGVQLFELSETQRLRRGIHLPLVVFACTLGHGDARPGAGRHRRRVVLRNAHVNAQALGLGQLEQLHAAAGTVLMQIIVDNHSGEMMPGDYASVRLRLPSAGATWSVPASALIFDARGLAVATLAADGRVRLRRITIGRDLGSIIEVASGLSATDRVIENPPDGVEDGTPVRDVGAGTPAKPGGHG